MNFNDILGLGKVLPTSKLLNLLSKSVGAFTKSYFDRRDIDTKAYEITKLTEAKVEAMKMVTAAVKESSDGIGGINYSEGGMTIESIKDKQTSLIQSSPDSSLEERTRSRIDHQEMKRQHNIEGVTSYAFEELKDEPPVTDEPVDEGWTSRFFKYAEEISDEGMQSIWGRILAGEIKQPNTYSLRTLDLLRNLSKQEAEIFTSACNLALGNIDSLYLYKSKQDHFLSQYEIDYEKLSILREAGLLHEGEFTKIQLLPMSQPIPTVFIASNRVIIVNRKPNSPTKEIPVYVFSQVGIQLSKLVTATPNIEYLNAFAKKLKEDDMTVNHAFLVEVTEGYVTHTNPALDFPII